MALAIEKCLLVTGEVDVTADLPSAPHLSSLGLVNVNPPLPPMYGGGGQVMTVDREEAGRARYEADSDGSAAFVGSLLETRGVAAAVGIGPHTANSDGDVAGPGPSSSAAGMVSKAIGLHHHHHHGMVHHHGEGNNHMEHIEVR